MRVLAKGPAANSNAAMYESVWFFSLTFITFPEPSCSDRVKASSDGTMPKFVLDRLCMAEATMTCMSGADDTRALLQRCGEMIQQGTATVSLDHRLHRIDW